MVHLTVLLNICMDLSMNELYLLHLKVHLDGVKLLLMLDIYGLDELLMVHLMVHLMDLLDLLNPRCKYPN